MDLPVLHEHGGLGFHLTERALGKSLGVELSFLAVAAHPLLPSLFFFQIGIWKKLFQIVQQED